MGTEIIGEATYRGSTHRVKLHLDGKALDLRDQLRLSIPLKQVREAVAKDGRLTIKWGDDQVILRVGDKAERLAEKILHPPSSLDKLGIKPGHTVSVLGLDDKAFLRDLRQRAAAVHTGSAESGSDVILFHAMDKKDLGRLKALQKPLKREGAIWILWRKGLKGAQDLKESDVMAAAKSSGLVDVKVASFSDELTALKLVIPKARR